LIIFVEFVTHPSTINDRKRKKYQRLRPLLADLVLTSTVIDHHVRRALWTHGSAYIRHENGIVPFIGRIEESSVDALVGVDTTEEEGRYRVVLEELLEGCGGAPHSGETVYIKVLERYNLNSREDEGNRKMEIKIK
jgi:hypothetical protein